MQWSALLLGKHEHIIHQLARKPAGNHSSDLQLAYFHNIDVSKHMQERVDMICVYMYMHSNNIFHVLSLTDISHDFLLDNS